MCPFGENVHTAVASQPCDANTIAHQSEQTSDLELELASTQTGKVTAQALFTLVNALLQLPQNIYEGLRRWYRLINKTLLNPLS